MTNSGGITGSGKVVLDGEKAPKDSEKGL